MATSAQRYRALVQTCTRCCISPSTTAAAPPIRTRRAFATKRPPRPASSLVPKIPTETLLDRQAWRDRALARTGGDEKAADEFTDILFNKRSREDPKAIARSKRLDLVAQDDEMDDMAARSGFEEDADADDVTRRTTSKMRKTLLNLNSEVDMEGDHPEDEYDNVTTTGHYNLEQVREIRHYARITAWEMPLLAQLAQEFEPPSLETPMRFRYTTYMGESHPAENKVVLEFCPNDIPGLSDVEKRKLIKLAGVRYNPETKIIKMSSESFETQVKNKRYLGDLVGKLIAEAKDTTDTFEDVPFDFRHHKFNTKKRYPASWNLDAKRMDYLQQYRRDLRAVGTNPEEIKQLTDGAEVLKRALRVDNKPAPQLESTAMEMAMATLGARKRSRPVAR